MTLRRIGRAQPPEAGALASPSDGFSISQRSYKTVAVVLATLLAANPLILFLLTHSIVWACVVPVTCVVAMLVVTSRQGWTIPSAYLFNAIALASLFAHAEVAFVYGFPDYVIENLYTIEDGYYFNRPFLNQTFTAKEYAVSYRTNAQGFRIGDGQDATHTYTGADWLVIGDSFTQGAQVDFSQLYTTLLNTRFPDKIIVNAGISGLGIGHEHNYFVKAGFRLKPDLVILQLCSFNDFTNVEPNLVGFTDRLMTYSAFLRFLLADFKFTNPATLPLGRWTEPFQPDAQANADFNIFYKESSKTKARDLESFERYLRQLRDAVTGDGARLLVVLIPTKEQVEHRYLDEVVHAFSIEPSQLDMQRPNTFLAALTHRMGIDFLDLLEPFKAAGGGAFLEYDEHLSPRGHQVMAAALGDLLQQTINSSLAHSLNTDSASYRYPRLSQDGTALTYQSWRDGNMELFLAAPDLTQRRQLTVNDVDESHPVLSRDKSQILFTQGAAESQRTKVVLMNTDGSQRRTLTSEPNVFGAIPMFSRSNLQIAYAEWTFDDVQHRFSLPRIVVRDVVYGSKRYLTGPNRDTWRPVFAPDDSHVFYIARTDGQFDIYATDLASGVERRLTNTPFDEWDPDVSPDGRSLVYAAHAAGNWDLFLLDLATGTTQQITATKGDEWDPSFSPDGTSVLFGGRYGLTEPILSMPVVRQE